MIEIYNQHGSITFKSKLDFCLYALNKLQISYSLFKKEGLAKNFPMDFVTLADLLEDYSVENLKYMIKKGEVVLDPDLLFAMKDQQIFLFQFKNTVPYISIDSVKKNGRTFFNDIEKAYTEFYGGKVVVYNS